MITVTPLSRNRGTADALSGPICLSGPSKVPSKSIAAKRNGNSCTPFCADVWSIAISLRSYLSLDRLEIPSSSTTLGLDPQITQITRIGSGHGQVYKFHLVPRWRLAPNAERSILIIL